MTDINSERSGPAPQSSSSRPAGISLPKGGGAIRGISEKLNFNAINGTATLTIALPTTPSRGGFSPDLQLHYDSGSGNGPFGMGWGLDVATITRRTDKGLPLYQDALESDIFMLAGAEDLVPMLDGSGTRVVIARTVHGIAFQIYPYLPRVEAGYARIERWVETSNGNTHWRTITANNITTIYGLDTDSTIADGAHVFKYLVCRRYDGRGNLIVYTYASESDDNVIDTATHETNRLAADRVRQRYVKSVRYGFTTPFFDDNGVATAAPALPADWHFELVFDYGEHDPDVPRPGDHALRPQRPDPFSSYRATFEIRTYRRCLRVLMFHHFADEPNVGRDCLVRAIELRYNDQLSPPDPAAPIFSLLVSATEVGFKRDGATYRKKSLPPLEIDYSKPEIDPTVRTLPRASFENLPRGVDGTYFRFADLDAEGMPGILSDDGTAWRFQRNSSPLSGVPLLDGSDPRVVASFEAITQVATVPSTHGLRDGIQLLDVRGEGQLDAVSFAQNLPGFWTREPEVGWDAFVPFRSKLATNIAESNVHIIDLTGDGRPDILIGEDNVWTMYPSLGEDGYGPAEIVRAPWDEASGGPPIYANDTEAIVLADMVGDGLADLVRIRNDEVCYWPNLGYGRFGRKVTMEGSPHVASPDAFDPRRVHLADIDGSGTSDVLYVGIDGVSVWFNRSGNTWSDPQRLAVFPSADSLASVQAIDLLGTGTACLVWSSPLVDQSHAPLRYVDLMSGNKPHLLTRTRNNMGSESRLTYAPSTRFYLADRRAGVPWITRLPFPVQVIERVETFDWIGRSRFVTRYAYHHGHYDGVEREFRGFGMVESWDTESHRGDTAFPDAENWDQTSWSPPVHTKTWFHTGVFLDGVAISKQFAHEYWIEPALRPDARAADLAAMTAPDSTIPSGLVPAELREGCRALKGHVLRMETYADDETAQAEFPYTVVEHNYAVRRLQPLAGNRYAVFATHDRESLTFHYERTPEDPRVAHDLVLEVDDFDQPMRSINVVYPRRSGYASPEPSLPAAFGQMLAYDQTRLHLMASEHRYTNAVLTDDAHRLPEPCETITAELTGMQPASVRAGITNLFRFDELDTAWTTAWDGAHDVAYEDLANPDIDGIGTLAAAVERRIVEQTRMYYRSDDLASLLPLGGLESLALAVEQFQLALTPGLLARVLDGNVGAAQLSEGGYVQLAASDGWWIPHGSSFYSPGDGDAPAVELAYARQHFYLVRREVDPFGSVSRTDLDAYDLIPVRAVDPAGNEHHATNDYRVLSPQQLTDPNGNRVEVAFDILGHVAGSAVMGKVTESLGDSLVGFEPDLDDATIAAHLADPLTNPLAILGSASARIVYDSDAYYRTRSLPTPAAPVAYILERESHVSAPDGATSRCRHELHYSDGNGLQIQRKLQAEPGPLVEGGPDVSPRWVGSGWLIHDNKGRTIRAFEPFFTPTHLFQFDQTIGVSRYTFYDPIGRIVATLAPNNTWHKTVHTAWREDQWDGNDTVLIADPRFDPDVGDHFRRLLGADPFISWYSLRVGGTYGVDVQDRLNEQDAAQKASAHAATPHTAHFDTLGRPCLSIDDLGVSGRHPTRTVFDAEGETLATIDAFGRRVVEYFVREEVGVHVNYVAGRDLAGRELFHNMMDGGARRMLPDVVGHPIRSWDARSHVVRLRYDVLRRPTHRYVATGGATEHLVARTVYGEGLPDRNLCGQLFRHYDQSGLTSNETCDFKGNLVDRSRTLAREYRDEVDWSTLGDATDIATLDTLGAPLLVLDDRFVARAFHDALNRPVQATTPHTATMRPNVVLGAYNLTGRVARVDVWEQVATEPTTILDPATADAHIVTHIDYDEYGDRTSITYGNGTLTTRTIDQLTKRLVRVTTARPNTFSADERIVQDLFYTYDPSGNVTRTRDDADIHDVVFFRNQRVEPSADYTYDAGYRVIRATGREHLGQTGGGLAAPAQPTDSDVPRTQLLHPGDGNAMGTYIETYQHDPLGNLLEILHQTSSGNWRRRYAYTEASQIEPSITSNRLSATSVPGDADPGPFSAKYNYDAHGNAIGMPHLSAMTWNERDSLSSTSRQVVNNGTPETTFYTYDASDNRIRKINDRSSASGPGTRRNERIYLGATEIYREYAADGTTVTLSRETFVIVAQRKVAAVLERRTSGTDPGPARTLRYQYVNLVNSSTLELDEAAGVITYEEYFPFGSTSYQAVRSQTDTPKRLRYAGKERDEESGFYCAGSRYYAPWLGRWFNPDPEGLSDGPNVYCYVHGNPIKTIDPTGTIGIVIVIGGVILTGADIAAIGGMATCATGVVVIATHPPPHVTWYADHDDDVFPAPPIAPPTPIPVPKPPPPPVAPPVEAPPTAPPTPVPWPPFGPIPIPGPVGPYPIPWTGPIPIPWPIAPTIPWIGPWSGPQQTPRQKPKQKPKTTDPIPTQPKPKPKDKDKDKKKPKTRYVTYTKYNKTTKKTYVGRSYGPASLSAKRIVELRDARHKKPGYDKAKLDREADGLLHYDYRDFDPAYWAIRGREQQMIDKYGGTTKEAAAAKKTTRSGNTIRGVRKDHPQRKDFDTAATNRFGRAAPYTGNP